METTQEKHLYECTKCGHRRDDRDGAPHIIPPDYLSPDGLPTVICPVCRVPQRARHAGGNWSVGKSYGAIVTDEPYEGGVRGYDHPEHMEAYGGYLIAESVAECNRAIIAAAPGLYDVLERLVRASYESQPAGQMELIWADAEAVLAKARGEVA